MLNPYMPISKVEDDKLNRGTFDYELAQVLLCNVFSSSFTIGLYGKWGEVEKLHYLT